MPDNNQPSVEECRHNLTKFAEYYLHNTRSKQITAHEVAAMKTMVECDEKLNLNIPPRINKPLIVKRKH